MKYLQSKDAESTPELPISTNIKITTFCKELMNTIFTQTEPETESEAENILELEESPKNTLI